MLFSQEDLENLTKMISAPEKEEAVRKTKTMTATPVSGMLATAPSPRFIKTHLPMSLLPPKILDTAKVMYVARDPRDVAVSCYYYAKIFKIGKYVREFKDFWKLFTNNLYMLTPYLEHVKEAWDRRNHPNMLFLFYEELSKDIPATLKRVADFLGKEVSDEDTARLYKDLKFEKFKNNESINFEKMRELSLLAENEPFVRTEAASGWRDYFDEETMQQSERWMQDNLRDTDLRFPHLNTN